MVVDVPADGATYRMEATKTDNGILTAISLENCNGLTPGLINAFWLDKGPLEYDFDCREVIGSFDPNQKSAVPTGTGAEYNIEANRSIQYTIDFQNTGTDTAFRVLLRDDLPSGLDILTFRPGASSHPYTWEIKQQRSLEVLFFPIALPDSFVNEVASHGFFSFEIAQNSDLPVGTVFENTAEIVFDYNPPIVTNTVRHIIGEQFVAVETIPKNTELWQVLGNPTTGILCVKLAEAAKEGTSLYMLDMTGRLIQTIQVAPATTMQTLDLATLPSGIYLVQLRLDAKVLGVAKVVKE